ncbi:MAG TPA: mandelate racemase/muconate lactonizing enzyme family protein, partial [Vicinamibacterales bacterium]|nr:mandelate racemase/muconate lactonizing enzyme family protein [Vicinamibacterales bacterium]
RRDFLGYTAALPFLFQFYELAAAQRQRPKIRDVQVMMLEGGRTYTLVKITADNGQFGIAEAYGSPGVGVKEQILSLKPWLVGKDPLEIDALYVNMGSGTRNLSGTRTDGSAHNLMRAVSGIEMALWDLAGKILDVPTSTLLGGKFRDRVRVYDHSAPKNMLDKGACKEWAAQVKAHPAGFTAHKFGFPHTSLKTDLARDPSNRVLTTRELINIQQGFENCREAIGWDHDIMVHCHWEYDLRTAIQIADAVESIKPQYLEDALPVDYTDSWRRLCESTKVPICMGENLARREGFKDFILNGGADILHPDLRNSGGFLETKRIADLAHIYGLPMATHNTGSQVNTYATCQWAASIRDYLSCETVTGEGGWMDQVLLLDGPYIKDGFIQVTDKPGLGITLNPDVVKAHLLAGETYWG